MPPQPCIYFPKAVMDGDEVFHSGFLHYDLSFYITP